MLSRREFLKSTGLIALAPTVPAFLARTLRAAEPDRDGRVLVVIQLDGGNDGINTVVPFKDEGYARYRKSLRLPAKELIKINEEIGLHRSLGEAAALLENGQLAIVQGVGYPNPSRSHAQSMAVWQTARLDVEEHKGSGWIGRGLDAGIERGDRRTSSLFVGANALPAALRGRRSQATALERLEDLQLPPGAEATRAAAAGVPASDLDAFIRRSLLDAYIASDRLKEAAQVKSDGATYPGTALAGRLQLIAQLLKAGCAARSYYTVQPGFDTHAAQLAGHANLLNELAGALRAFIDDLTRAKLAERVTVLAFSEFGRTVQENGSAGTDHGTAGPVFLAGPGVKGGLAGTAPNLLDLEDGEPKKTVDFRQVYASVLEDWLRLPARASLGGEFQPLPLFRT